ncbi:MAG TPA: hypothetical protein VGN33_09720, partial [Leifsonia sp.]|nr:hypothetical protein [Leifsonia sp.]
MSTHKHPVGPRSAALYRRRRAVVLLGLLAVVIIIVLILVRPGSGHGEPVPASTHSPAHSPVSTPAATSRSAAGSGSAPTSTSSPTDAAAADGAPCKPANIRVQAITDASSYAAGQHPMLSLSLTNTGSSSCHIDAGTAKQVYTITSGSDTYWVSTDCQQNATDTTILLAPNKTVTSTPIEWDRTRSDPTTCNATRPAAPAGGASYHLTTSLDGI